MKRFWREVTVDAAGGAHAVLLDERGVKTPARNALELPTPALAEAVAAEWRDVGESVDPRVMPLTGLANAALDLVMPDPARFAEPLARYGANDLLCYRAEDRALAAEQAAAWDPLLDWARGRYDISFAIAEGVMPVDQPPATIARLGEALLALSPFQLAAVAPLVTIGGSLIVALAVEAGALSGETGWDAVTLDEMWQERRWGEDADAKAARDARQQDWDAAVRFLTLL